MEHPASIRISVHGAKSQLFHGHRSDLCLMAQDALSQRVPCRIRQALSVHPTARLALLLVHRRMMTLGSQPLAYLHRALLLADQWHCSTLLSDLRCALLLVHRRMMTLGSQPLAYLHRALLLADQWHCSTLLSGLRCSLLLVHHRMMTLGSRMRRCVLKNTVVNKMMIEFTIGHTATKKRNE
jgi:hypothetical protein